MHSNKELGSTAEHESYLSEINKETFDIIDNKSIKLGAPASQLRTNIEKGSNKDKINEHRMGTDP